jgi:hypothetical protein
MDLIISIVEWIWRFYLGFCCVFTTFFMVKFFTGLNSAISNARATKTELAVVKLVSVEEIDGRLMMYDGINHRFICQAVTEDELWATAKNLFPSIELQRI